MPYIKPESRKKYESSIQEVTNLITSANVPITSKIEYFGYFTCILTCKYVQINEIISFNQNLIPDATRKRLNELAVKIATLIGASDPLEAAGDLNYCITSVFWPLIDGGLNRYGYRAFLSGCLRQIIGKISSKTTMELGVPHLDSRDRILASRRHVVALGVLNDVLDETYRRKTSIYEDEKILQNGDV